MSLSSHMLPLQFIYELKRKQDLKHIFSKMRLVPVKRNKKELTIPRLELLAVLIGVKAANFVSKELRLKIPERILWTDSQCVLHWLKTKKPLSFSLRTILRKLNWRKISFTTHQYRADLVTRGLSVQEIIYSTLWCHEPSWLLDDHIQYGW